MTPQTTTRKLLWLPILLIAWNLFDIVVHVAVDMVEPLRVTGNIVGIVAALVILLANVKQYASTILSGAAFVVLIVNVIHAMEHGVLLPGMVFIGVAIFLLLCWAQVELQNASAEDKAASSMVLRWWVSLVATLGALVLVVLSSVLFGPGMDAMDHVIAYRQSTAHEPGS